MVVTNAQVWDEIILGLSRLRVELLLVQTEQPRRDMVVVTGIGAAIARELRNQTTVEVQGRHFLKETSGPEIGQAVADFVRKLRTQ